MATMRNPRDSREEDDDRNRNADYSSSQEAQSQRGNDDKCNDGETPTELSILREQGDVCTAMRTKGADVLHLQEVRAGAHQIYYNNKRSFLETEVNYQYYRNMELAVGVELMNMKEGVVANIGQYKTSNTKLIGLLKSLTAATKDALGKFEELKQAACKLNICVNSTCQSSQKKILTGESADNCHGGGDEINDKCNSRAILKDLETIPSILLEDANLLFSSSARVSGIQAFSNVDSLEPLGGALSERAKKFDDFIVDRMNKGAEALKKAQEDLSGSVKALTIKTTEVYYGRSLFKGLKQTVYALCECRCDCIRQDDAKHRLEDCKCRICDIGEAVKAGVCDIVHNPACRPHEHDKTQSVIY